MRESVQLEKHIGEQISRARVRMGMSLDDLADACQLASAQLAAYERGHVRATPEHLMLIAKILKISFLALFPNPQSVPQRYGRRKGDQARQTHLVEDESWTDHNNNITPEGRKKS